MTSPLLHYYSTIDLSKHLTTRKIRLDFTRTHPLESIVENLIQHNRESIRGSRNGTTMLKFSLEGRRFVLRYLRPADVEKYLIFFNELSEQTIRCRFGYLLASLTESAAKQRTNVNTDNEKAVAIFDPDQDRIIAIGRCYLDFQTLDSEIALVVSETMRGFGLGRILLNQLVQIAREEKSKTISAFIATHNTPVIQLLQSTGFMFQAAIDGDDSRLVLKILPSISTERAIHPIHPTMMLNHAL